MWRAVPNDHIDVAFRLYDEDNNGASLSEHSGAWWVLGMSVEGVRCGLLQAC